FPKEIGDPPWKPGRCPEDARIPIRTERKIRVVDVSESSLLLTKKAHHGRQKLSRGLRVNIVEPCGGRSYLGLEPPQCQGLDGPPAPREDLFQASVPRAAAHSLAMTGRIRPVHWRYSDPGDLALRQRKDVAG